MDKPNLCPRGLLKTQGSILQLNDRRKEASNRPNITQLDAVREGSLFIDGRFTVSAGDLHRVYMNNSDDESCA